MRKKLLPINKAKYSCSGFTLVELAIVLMIIGLLIGGVLRGQELIKNAQVTSTIKQVQSYHAAITTFQDMYFNLPGDMSSATTKIANCNTANNCLNGDGNALIGQTMGAGYCCYNNYEALTPAITSENTQFWKHLALAHMITGIDPSAATPAWGKSHPIAPVGGGFYIRYAKAAIALNQNNIQGHFIVLRSSITGDATNATNGTINPKVAAQIDRKMDDGYAVTGSAISWSNQYNTGCGYASDGEDGPNGYNETSDRKSCDMAFLMQ